MTVALSAEYPLLDLFWTMLLALGLAVFLWTILVVFRDLFGRTDIGPWWKTLWVLAVLLLPIAGSLVYLITRGEAMEAGRLRRRGTEYPASDPYLHAVSGSDQFRGVRDTRRTSQVWSGPMHAP